MPDFARYDSPGFADELSPELDEAWQAEIGSVFDRSNVPGASLELDRGALDAPESIAGAVHWFGSPAEPEFCLGREWARKLSDWDERGRSSGTKMTHRRITPTLGRRIIDIAVYNGDSVPDVILMTAQIAGDSRRTTDTRVVAAEAERQGRRIDRFGWIVFAD